MPSLEWNSIFELAPKLSVIDTCAQYWISVANQWTSLIDVAWQSDQLLFAVLMYHVAARFGLQIDGGLKIGQHHRIQNPSAWVTSHRDRRMEMIKMTKLQSESAEDRNHGRVQENSEGNSTKRQPHSFTGQLTQPQTMRFCCCCASYFGSLSYLRVWHFCILALISG